MIKHSYRPDQVVCLLTPYAGPVIGKDEKEDRLRAGEYYGDMLSQEDLPEASYLTIFDKLLNRLSRRVAPALMAVAYKIAQSRGPKVVLVSLARAGTPIGVVLADVLRERFGKIVSHYTVSVIHRNGLDRHALAYLLAHHEPEDLAFFDGWVSQGRITRALEESLVDQPRIDPTLFCVSDPSGIQNAAGTRVDVLLPSAVLNASVSGLMSRTVFNADGFHAAAYCSEQASVDRTQAFISAMLEAVSLEKAGPPEALLPAALQRPLALAQLQAQAESWGVSDDRIKAGIGEVSRSLLRRAPAHVLIDPSAQDEVDHLVWLAELRRIPLTFTPLPGPYRAFSLLS